MRQPCAQMVARTVEKHLRLVFEPAKSARMNDPRAVALKFGAISVALLRIFSPARFARLLRERRERCSLSLFHLIARFPTVFHLPGVFVSNFSRRARRARRASNRMINKSKIARSAAVKVSQTHAIQNEITNHGCSRGFMNDCKTVNPANNISIASPRRIAIALRRARCSRIRPRVAWTTNDAACNSFSCGEFSIADSVSILQFIQPKTIGFSGTIRDALIAQSEKGDEEDKSGCDQKEAGPRAEAKQPGRWAQGAARCRILSRGCERQDIRREPEAFARALR